MKERKGIVNCNLSNYNNFVDINLYEVSPGMTPVKKEDLVLITNTIITSMMIIEVKTKDLIYPKDLSSLKLQLYEDVMTNSIQFRMYKINSLSYPTSLPSSYNVITQQTEDVTGYKKRVFNIGEYLTSPNTTYYFFVQPYAKSGSSSCNIKLNVGSNTNKLATFNVEYLCDMQLPQYLKHDNNKFKDCLVDVNLFNGKFNLTKPLVNFKGNRLPMNLCFIVNNYMYDYAYVNLTTNVYYNYNDKFKFNYFQIIKKHCIEDKYLYINDKGELLYFSKVKDGYYINDNGRGLYLIKNTNSYIIEDINGNQLEFNNDGYLVYIRDNIESEIGTYTKGVKITYTKTNNISYLTSVKDSIDREVVFTYNTSYIKLTHSIDKEITLNIDNTYIESIENEYGENLYFIYFDNKLSNISIDDESLKMSLSTNELNKLEYTIDDQTKYTKEYAYVDTNANNITTITAYKNQKNNLNQIVHKYCFDCNGNYEKDYEVINGEPYNENKRYQNFFEVQCELNKKNENTHSPNYEESITTISNILINDDNKMICSLDTNEYKKTFNRSFTITPNNAISSDKIIYSFNINYKDIITSNTHSATINISIDENINNNINTIHKIMISANKENGFYAIETNQKYSGYLKDAILYVECEIPLKWYNLTNESIKLNLSVEMDYITNIVIDRANIMGEIETLPIAYFPSLYGLLPIEGMYYYDDYSINNYHHNKNKSKNVYLSTMYGLTNPHKLIYKENGESKNIDDFKITLNELMINAKNKAKAKKIFWYNEFKNAIIEDDLYMDGAYPIIIFDNNEQINISNLTFTVPLFKNENEKCYTMYHFNNLYGDTDSKYIEATLKETLDNSILVKIVTKDIYDRIISEEETDRIYSNTDNYCEDGYISIIKEYKYDDNGNNNIIEENQYTLNIYENTLEEEVTNNSCSIEYLYDANNNIISKKVNNVEILYEYDVNNNLIKITYPKGTIKHFVYNDKDQVTNIYVTNNDKEMRNIVSYLDYERINTLIYNNGKSGFKYLYDNENKLNSIYKINNTIDYELQIENYQLLESDDEEFNLSLLENQYAIIITDGKNNKEAQIYDKYGKIIYIKKYEENIFKLVQEFVYQDGCTSNEIKTFESLVKFVIDYEESVKYEYIYNDDNELITFNRYKINEDQTETLLNSTTYEYLCGKLYKENTNEFLYEYNYGRFDLLNQFKIDYLLESLLSIDYEYTNDGLLKAKSVKHHNVNNKNTNEYTFNDNRLVEYKTQYLGEEYTIEYDNESRIIEINSTKNIQYIYNSFGHLVEEINTDLNKKYEYCYDEAGNIISKKIYSLNNVLEDETTFVYDAPSYDVLTKIIKNGETINITYDSNLQPLTINNNTLQWNNTRKLNKYIKGSEEYNYFYNASGIRYKKALSKTNTEIIEYNLEGDKILLENRKIESNGEYVDNYTLKYIYEGNNILGFIYSKNNQETLYMYEKDPLNTIKALIKVTDKIEIVALYKYNAWGEHIVCNPDGTINSQSDFIGNINPFRYRGYYYDVETQLFYCNSRYYSPELCRWISPDSIEYLDPQSINGLNLYCYCMNNPIMYADPSGHFAVSTFLIGLAASWVISSIASYYLGEHLVSGATSVYGGVQTIATGISLLAYGPVGWMLGGAAIALGAVNIAFGTAELQQHFTGNNWINDIGITGDLYTGLYIGSSIASAAVSIGGTAYMNSSAGKLAYEIQQNAKYWDKGTFHTRYGSMKYHYKTHANGMTPTQYTQSAIDFSTFNSSSFKYTYNYKYKNASWNFINMYGVGGYYNSAGKIITFFF